MIIAIHQPNYIPWAGYFFKILQSDIFVFLDDAQFSNGSFINRTNIIVNSKKSWMSIPVKKKLGIKINQVAIADPIWKIKHLSKIKNTYIKCEHFSDIWNRINTLYESIESNYLFEINRKIIITISKWLDSNSKFFLSSSLNINENIKAENKILEIVKCFKGITYISGKGGKNYQDEKNFINDKVNLVYIESLLKSYEQKQNNEKFIPGLSILDLFFNLGIEATKNYIYRNFKLL